MIITSLLAVGAQTPSESLEARIQSVTLYRSQALVQRSARIDASGRYVIRGLPAVLDPNQVRASCTGGEVVSIEPQLRREPAASAERIETLRRELLKLSREIQSAQDERAVSEGLKRHLDLLGKQEAEAQAQELRTGRPAPEAWDKSYDFLKVRLAQVTREMREIDWRLEDLKAAHAAAEQAYLNAQGGAQTQVYDLLLDLVAQPGCDLELKYLVSGTGWEPAYDLRVRKDLDAVDLTYRAKIWQQTGEDWSDVQIALSTAQPQVGAQGPDPVARWVDLQEVRPSRGLSAPAVMAEMNDAGSGPAEQYLGFSAGLAAPSAVVEEGLSVRYELRDKAKVLSRAEASTVLVGTSRIAIQPERVCVPSLDLTVWLRGRATNTSPWVLLPGTAAVFFGADFLGNASLVKVMTGEEFVVHLGADPALTCERTKLEDQSKEAGLFSSRASQVETWKLLLRNNGCIAAKPDGSVDVIVREVLPKSKDDRIRVELTRAEPRVSQEERWKREREEQGFLTWVLSVPRGETGAQVLWQSTVTYPEDQRLILR